MPDRIPGGEKPKTVDVGALFSYDNPALQTYRDMEYESTPNHMENNWETFKQRFGELSRLDEGQWLVHAFKGANLFDPGGGLSAKFGRECGQILDLNSYTLIDRYLNREDTPCDASINFIDQVPIERPDNLPMAAVREDALIAVAQIPDNSASFVLSLFDQAIVPDTEYQEALAAEMTRALSPNGVILNSLTWTHEYFEENGLIEVPLDDTLSFSIFIKSGGQTESDLRQTIEQHASSMEIRLLLDEGLDLDRHL